MQQELSVVDFIQRYIDSGFTPNATERVRAMNMLHTSVYSSNGGKNQNLATLPNHAWLPMLQKTLLSQIDNENFWRVIPLATVRDPDFFFQRFYQLAHDSGLANEYTNLVQQAIATQPLLRKLILEQTKPSDLTIDTDPTAFSALADFNPALQYVGAQVMQHKLAPVSPQAWWAQRVLQASIIDADDKNSGGRELVAQVSTKFTQVINRAGRGAVAKIVVLSPIIGLPLGVLFSAWQTNNSKSPQERLYCSVATGVTLAAGLLGYYFATYAPRRAALAWLLAPYKQR